MRILYDDNMPLVAECFADWGQLIPFVGRGLTPADIQQADMLLVRSITPVTKTLLKNSSVRFIGSATIGTDHIEMQALSAAGVSFAHAPGCNARAVAEYVLTTAVNWAAEKSVSLNSLRLAVVGYGNVGREVTHLLQPLVGRLIIVDPLLAADEFPDQDFVAIDQALRADVISLHVPLTREGGHATHHLFSQQRLSMLADNQLLINSSRGAVVDNAALELCEADVVLDVWEGEPVVSASVLSEVFMGTPHVAGHTLEGKYSGTYQLYLAACEFFQKPVCFELSQDQEFSRQQVLSVKTASSEQSVESWIASVLNQVVPLKQDYARLCDQLSAVAAEDRGVVFDRLRKQYTVRREFSAFQVKADSLRPDELALLNHLGFRIW